jgi:hypothetical protein
MIKRILTLIVLSIFVGILIEANFNLTQNNKKIYYTTEIKINGNGNATHCSLGECYTWTLANGTYITTGYNMAFRYTKPVFSNSGGHQKMLNRGCVKGLICPFNPERCFDGYTCPLNSTTYSHEAKK